ncbi:ER membrane protein complex subunit 1-like isoform X1 [Halichondria panicea]|uniref:ER membrane protein complex subunit 1-like isoform X1 n=1 Tax=Halichondria panicea TaxID=6063 RepID=UPI00312BB571
MAHSENWVVYEFFNSKQRRHELVVLELYEIHTNQSHTVWSSLAPPPTPAVMSQAYTLPTTITTLTTTQTLRGITYKGVIFGLASGRVVIMPKSLLNHRRELEITDQMKEDGTPPYHPEIPFNPLSFVNYNRTVARIREIYATPSGLESTCLLFVCGLDLYYTRVTPSNQFDLLAEDFDYTLISAVVVGMFVATLVLSRLSAKKMLKSLWK